MESAMAKSVSYAQWSLEPYCIGMKLRALRTRKHLTLSRLAAETDLSTALLSKLETERMIPTLPTLATICRIYGVGMGYFFCEPTKHSLSVTRKAHLEASGRIGDSTGSIPLNAPAENPRLHAEMLELSKSSYVFAAVEGDVCALLHVLEGSVQLVTDGMTQVLETGDCAYMETRVPTSLSAVGDKRCRILLVRPAHSAQGSV
jgi:transcriptional regulator with XRE-family HTH domain